MSGLMLAGGDGGDDGFLIDPKNQKMTLQQIVAMSQSITMVAQNLIIQDKRLTDVEAKTSGLTDEVEGIKAQFDNLDAKIESGITVNSSQQKQMRQEIARRVYAVSASTAQRPQHFRNVHDGLQDRFDVNSYKDIPRSKLRQALQLVAAYDGTRGWYKL